MLSPRLSQPVCQRINTYHVDCKHTAQARRNAVKPRRQAVMPLHSAPLRVPLRQAVKRAWSSGQADALAIGQAVKPCGRQRKANGRAAESEARRTDAQAVKPSSGRTDGGPPRVAGERWYARPQIRAGAPRRARSRGNGPPAATAALREGRIWRAVVAERS